MIDKLEHHKQRIQRILSGRGMLSVVITTALLLPGSSAYANGGVLSVGKSTLSQKYIVEIDGVTQPFGQPPVSINNTTMVPMRSIFEALGAMIKFDQKTQLITATKEDTTIKLTVGSKVAYVNSEAVNLAVKAQTINNSTMVPLRFVAEALGATVSWYPETLTIVISGEGAITVQPSIGYTYGNHGYGSANYSQYLEVMKYIMAAKQTYGMVHFDGGGRYEALYQAYLNGDRASNYAEGTLESRGLTQAENSMGALINNGVSAAKAEEAYKVGRIASILVEGVSNPGDGTPSSAYDALVAKKSDCDSDANVFSAVFDSFGYNTAIVASKTHADMIVQISGKWYTYAAGQFDELSVSNLSASGLYVYTQPTTGSFN